MSAVVRRSRRPKKEPELPRVVKIDFSETKTEHCKAYIAPSFDRAIKQFQIELIRKTGENITYSEAVRRLLMLGIWETFENRCEFINMDFRLPGITP